MMILYILILITCVTKYYEEDECLAKFEKLKDNNTFSVLSLNIRSLPVSFRILRIFWNLPLVIIPPVHKSPHYYG